MVECEVMLKRSGARLFTTTSVRLSSGFSDAERPRGGVPGAGAPAGGTRDGRGGDDPRADGSVRAAGGGQVRPGQHTPLRGHVSQLAAQRL